MIKKCNKCDSIASLVEQQPKLTWHFLPDAGSPLDITIGLICENCGHEYGFRKYVRYSNIAAICKQPEWADSSAEPSFAIVMDGTGQALSYHCYQKELSKSCTSSFSASTASKSVKFPANEAFISSPNFIGQHGDPDLMMEFSKQYLIGFHKIMPKHRLPSSISEIAPALSLLLNSAELAIKSFIYISEIYSNELRGHKLERLYLQICAEHTDVIKLRFSETDLCRSLLEQGVPIPEICHVLRFYEPDDNMIAAYGSVRYFAEPTVITDKETPKGMLMGKPMMYPIFLPSIVQTMIEVYDHSSGCSKLRRMFEMMEGGNISHAIRFEKYVGWYLNLPMFGFVLVKVLRREVVDEKGVDREHFAKFLKCRKPIYRSKRNNEFVQLLFYKRGVFSEFGSRLVDGVNCDVSTESKFLFNAIELYRMANTLEQDLSR